MVRREENFDDSRLGNRVSFKVINLGKKYKNNRFWKKKEVIIWNLKLMETSGRDV